jgi:3-isopropylmalate dehydrogenase
MTYSIAVIPGDGVGPEIMEATLRVLEHTDVSFDFQRVDAGDTALREHGQHLPDETMDVVRRSVAVLKGPIGESARHVVLPLRQELGLFANLRPAKSIRGVKTRLMDSEEVDLLIVRENSEGLYSMVGGRRGGVSFDIKVTTKQASERIMRFACEEAITRRGHLTIVHKANVLHSDRHFQEVCLEVAREYADLSVNQMYVDNCAYQLVRAPSQFDVIVTQNLYGDILSDVASWVQGGMGTSPGANLSDSQGMFEPVHGAAFDIANQNVANPTALLLSAVLMLQWLATKHSDRQSSDWAQRMESSVFTTIRQGHRTRDLQGSLSTSEYTDCVIDNL